MQRKRAPKLAIEDRRALLLDCALSAFARKGLTSATHADVAKEAAVAVPTVFAYFATRQALIEAVLAEIERVILNNAHEAAAAYSNVPDQYLAVLRDFADFIDIDPRPARLWVNWSATFSDDVAPLYARFVEATLDFHRQMIADGLGRGEQLASVDPEMSAYEFIGAATVIVQMKVRGVATHSVDQYIEAARHGALHQR